MSARIEMGVSLMRSCPIRLLAAMLVAGLLGWIPSAWATDTPQFELSWGSSGGGNSQFWQALGIACDSDGNVYVLDWGGGSGPASVKKFDGHGGFITQWTTAGAEDLNEPISAAESPDGHLFVLQNDGRVHKFNLDGSHVLSFGSCCHGAPERLWAPWGIAIDEDGLIYIADSGNSRIAVFDGDGNFVRDWSGGLHEPKSITTDRLGTIFVVDFNSSSQQSWVKSFSKTGAPLAGWGTGTFPDEPLATGGIACATQLFVITGWSGMKLKMTNRAGVDLVPDFGGSGIAAGKFSLLYGVAVDPSGNIFALDANLNRVSKFSAVTVAAAPVTWGWIKHIYR